MPNVFIARGDQRQAAAHSLGHPFLNAGHVNNFVFEYVSPLDVTLAYVQGFWYSDDVRAIAEEHLPPGVFVPFEETSRHRANDGGWVEELRLSNCHPLTRGLFLATDPDLHSRLVEARVGSEENTLYVDGPWPRPWCPIILQVQRHRLTPAVLRELVIPGIVPIWQDLQVAGDYVALGRKRYTIGIQDGSWYSGQGFDTLAEIQACLTNEYRWEYVQAGYTTMHDSYTTVYGTVTAVKDLTIPFLLAADSISYACRPQNR